MFDRVKLKMKLMEKGLSVETLAEATGMNVSTCYRKIKRDGDFSREEIQAIRETIGMTTEEAEEVFFASKLTKTQVST